MTAPYDAMDPTAETPEDDEEIAQDPSGQRGGWWLDEPNGAKVKDAVLAAWKRQDAIASKGNAKDRRNALLRAGVRGARVVEDEDTDTFFVRAPFGADGAPKAPSKSDQLIRRVASTLTADPAYPEVEPNSDNDQERAAAELSEKMLRVEGAPAQRDDASMLREAIDRAGTYRSIFRYTYLHPQDRLVPVEIQATRTAQTVQDALLVMDPNTQEMTPADPSMLMTRYVRADDTLTDVEAEARLRWEPRVCECFLTPAQVRWLPVVGVGHIEDAEGVLIGQVLTLGEVIGRCYGGERPDEVTVKQLVDWKPDGVDVALWVPQSRKAMIGSSTPVQPSGLIDESALVTVIWLYYRSGPTAPIGAVLAIGGPPDPLVREPWRASIGEGASAKVEYFPLPLAQLRWREDSATDDPLGVAGIEDLAPLEEMRATMLRMMYDYADRYGDPQPFFPVGTVLQPAGWRPNGRYRDPLFIPPDGRPFFDEVPALSPIVEKLFALFGAEMDTASGLEEAAQGVSSASVKSGTHARQIIEQALVALAGLKQNSDRFITRVWALRLTFMRAYYTTPRLLKNAGEGGDFQLRAWRGVDLMGAGDVRIAKGSGTMMTPSAKQAMAREDLEVARTVGDPTAAMRYYREITGRTSPILGLQDDPIRVRMQRQLETWREQAKGQYEPAPPPQPQVVGVDAMGQPIVQPVPAPDPVAQQAAQVFAPLPVDELPTVAPQRLQALAEEMAKRTFLQADPRYQQALVGEYQRMKAAAGVYTVAEQQQMQAQQAAMQQQLQAEQIQSENAEQAAQTAYAESTGGPAAQTMAYQGAAEAAGAQG